MNATLQTAQVLTSQDAARLGRDLAVIRMQADRPAIAKHDPRPTGFAVVTAWFTTFVGHAVLRPVH